MSEIDTATTGFEWNDGTIMSVYDQMQTLNPESLTGADSVTQQAYANALAVREQEIALAQYQINPSAYIQNGNLPPSEDALYAAENTAYDFLASLSAEQGEALSLSVNQIATANVEAGVTAPAPEVVAGEQYLADAGLNSNGTGPLSASRAFASATEINFGDNLLDALGVERSWLGGHKGIWNQGDVREVLADRSPDEILDAIGTADMNLKSITDLVKGDTDLAASFKNALVNDPTMLDGMQEIFSAEGDAFNKADLERILHDPRQREVLGNVLDKVAESDEYTFADVNKILNHHKNGETQQMFAHLQSMGVLSADIGMEMFGEFMAQLMENPEMAINDLINQLDSMGMLGDMDPEMLKGFLAPMGEMMAFVIEPYYDLAVTYDIGADTPGRIADAATAGGAALTAQYGGPINDLLITAGMTPEVQGVEVTQQTLTEHIQAALSDGQLTFDEYRESVNATGGINITGLEGVANIETTFGEAVAGQTATQVAENSIEMMRNMQAGQTANAAFTNSFS